MEFQVVVMRYMEDVAWVENLENAIIYNKGSKIESIHPVVNLPNIGMYHASQLYHCINNYNNLADMTLFIQANPWDGDLEVDLKIKNSSYGIKKMIEYFAAREDYEKCANLEKTLATILGDSKL